MQSQLGTVHSTGPIWTMVTRTKINDLVLLDEVACFCIIRALFLHLFCVCHTQLTVLSDVPVSFQSCKQLMTSSLPIASRPQQLLAHCRDIGCRPQREKNRKKRCDTREAPSCRPVGISITARQRRLTLINGQAGHR